MGGPGQLDTTTRPDPLRPHGGDGLTAEGHGDVTRLLR